MEATIVLTTFENQNSARSISSSLVQEGLAACASIIPAQSIYVWEGKLQDTPECMVIFKTTSENAPLLCLQIEKRHPYQTPEVLLLNANWTSHPYMKWLADSVR